MPSIPLQIPRLPQKIQIGTYVTQLPKACFVRTFRCRCWLKKVVLWFQVNFDPPLNDRGVLKVEDWGEICRLHRAEGMAIRAIARRLEISRNAVKKAVTSHEPPRYVRAGAGSAVDGFPEALVRKLLEVRWPKPSTRGSPTHGRPIDDLFPNQAAGGPQRHAACSGRAGRRAEGDERVGMDEVADRSIVTQVSPAQDRADQP